MKTSVIILRTIAVVLIIIGWCLFLFAENAPYTTLISFLFGLVVALAANVLKPIKDNHKK